jgi:hypothetical protein
LSRFREENEEYVDKEWEILREESLKYFEKK